MKATKKNKLFIAIVFFIPSFVFFFLCPNTVLSEPIKVKMAASPGFLFLPAYVAQEEGYFEREGLKVEIIDFQGGAEVTTAMVGGSVDVGATMAERPLILQGKGFKAKNLVSLQDKLAFTLIVRNDIQGNKDNLKVLKGLKIGISRPGGGLDRALRALIVHAGLKPDQDTAIIAIGTNGVAAMEAKSVDGLMSAEPTTSMLLFQKKTAKSLVDFRKGEAPPEINHMTFSTLQASDKYIQSNPLAVEKIITAISKVERDLRKNPKLAIKTGKKMLPAISEEILENIIREESVMYHPAISKEALESINKALLKSGEISKAIPYEEAVATQFTSLWKD